MFEDARRDTQPDRLGVVLNDVEEWLEDNGYDVAEAVRTGALHWSDAGYSVAVENDGITIGYVESGGGEPAIRTYELEELWGMDEEEFREELDELVEDAS